MATEVVSFINPVFVDQHLVFAATAETAVQNVVAALQRLAGALSDDERARAEIAKLLTAEEFAKFESLLPKPRGPMGPPPERR